MRHTLLLFAIVIIFISSGSIALADCGDYGLLACEPTPTSEPITPGYAKETNEDWQDMCNRTGQNTYHKLSPFFDPDVDDSDVWQIFYDYDCAWSPIVSGIDVPPLSTLASTPIKEFEHEIERVTVRALLTNYNIYPFVFKRVVTVIVLDNEQTILVPKDYYPFDISGSTWGYETFAEYIAPPGRYIERVYVTFPYTDFSGFFNLGGVEDILSFLFNVQTVMTIEWLKIEGFYQPSTPTVTATPTSTATATSTPIPCGLNMIYGSQVSGSLEAGWNLQSSLSCAGLGCDWQYGTRWRTNEHCPNSAYQIDQITTSNWSAPSSYYSWAGVYTPPDFDWTKDIAPATFLQGKCIQNSVLGGYADMWSASQNSIYVKMSPCGTWTVTPTPTPDPIGANCTTWLFNQNETPSSMGWDIAPGLGTWVAFEGIHPTSDYVQITKSFTQPSSISSAIINLQSVPTTTVTLAHIELPNGNAIVEDVQLDAMQNIVMTEHTTSGNDVEILVGGQDFTIPSLSLCFVEAATPTMTPTSTMTPTVTPTTQATIPLLPTIPTSTSLPTSTPRPTYTPMPTYTPNSTYQAPGTPVNNPTPYPFPTPPLPEGDFYQDFYYSLNEVETSCNWILPAVEAIGLDGFQLCMKYYNMRLIAFGVEFPVYWMVAAFGLFIVWQVFVKTTG